MRVFDVPKEERANIKKPENTYGSVALQRKDHEYKDYVNRTNDALRKVINERVAFETALVEEV